MSSQSKSRGWCATINNYTDVDVQQFDSIPTVYRIRGNEVGDSGTPHLQCYLYFKSPRTRSAVSKFLPRAFLTPAKGSAQENKTYCSKEGNFVEDGVLPVQGRRTDLSAAVDTLMESGLKECCAQHPEVFVRYGRGLRDVALTLTEPYAHDSVRGIWVYGPPGVGKSRYAHDTYPDAYRKSMNKWFDGYDGEETIVLDDFDKAGSCLSHHLKIWTDRYPCNGETKGGTVCLRHKQFVVTSNYSISELWPDDDVLVTALLRRFKVIHMPQTPFQFLDSRQPPVDEVIVGPFKSV